MQLPEDVLNEIVSHMDYKSYTQYCQTQVNKTCKITNKLEQEIKVPLIAYDSTQINKISNMVIHDSFRNDIVIYEDMYFINEYGHLVITNRNRTEIFKNHYVKIIQSKHKSYYENAISTVLLLDNMGKVWVCKRINTYGKDIKYIIEPLIIKDIKEDIEENAENEEENYIIDIAIHNGLRMTFFIAVTKEGYIYAAITEDFIDSETEFVLIGHVENAVKVAVGNNHVLVLDQSNDVYFFSQRFINQVPIDSKEKLIRFQQIPNITNIVQILAVDDDSLCLDNKGNIHKFTPYQSEYIYFNHPISYMKCNKEHVLLLNNLGKLYKMSLYLLHRIKEDEYLIANNVCNMAIEEGKMHDIVVINNEGIYNSGHTMWNKGSVYTKPYKELILYKYYKLI